jgi:hypothetical protein
VPKSKFASPVREDEHGIYVVTNGEKYRPGGIPGYDHAYDMSDMGLKKGDRVWARHRAQSPLALVTRYRGERNVGAEVSDATTRTAIWGNDYLHESYRNAKPSSGILDCGACYECLKDKTHESGLLMTATRMILCPTCGCKRCPKATDHRLACTDSNEPGQPGSIYR